MTKFWKQDWFRDALPFVAAGVAATGLLGALGAFGGGALGSLGGGADGVAPDAAGGMPDLSKIAMPGAAPGALAEVPGQALAAATERGAGNIDAVLPEAIANVGDPKSRVTGLGIPILDDVVSWAGRNPSQAMTALALGASALGSASSPRQPDGRRLAEEQARRDLERWNAIPVQPGPNRRALAPPGAPGRQEQRYFENYAEGGALRASNHLRGPGDGMSDDIPALAHGAGGTRPVHVADGEYVIPADVVSGIGNGSTEAGVRQLDALLRRVRHERHPKKGQQPPAVDPSRLMPA
ncbi:hypothetical protein [Planktothrix phage Pra-JY27]|nr:extracellular solute-binding protein [Planktothrix phage Pag-Yong1]WEV89209.1 calcium-binding protein [Synechococcus phage MinM2]